MSADHVGGLTDITLYAGQDEAVVARAEDAQEAYMAGGALGEAWEPCGACDGHGEVLGYSSWRTYGDPQRVVSHGTCRDCGGDGVVAVGMRELAPCGEHPPYPEQDADCPDCRADARAEAGWAAYELDHEAGLGGL